MLRYCNTCTMNKPEIDFKKYGKECADCRKLRVESSKAKFYINRVRCKCGLYYSDANPREKHEQSQAHKNYLIYGHRGGADAVRHFQIALDKNPNKQTHDYVRHLEQKSDEHFRAKREAYEQSK